MSTTPFDTLNIVVLVTSIATAVTLVAWIILRIRKRRRQSPSPSLPRSQTRLTDPAPSSQTVNAVKTDVPVKIVVYSKDRTQTTMTFEGSLSLRVLDVKPEHRSALGWLFMPLGRNNGNGNGRGVQSERQGQEKQPVSQRTRWERLE